MSRRIVVVAALFAITACERPTAPASALSADLKLASAAGTKTNEWQPISAGDDRGEQRATWALAQLRHYCLGG